MIIVLLTLWGLCLGSFVNALVFRLHLQSGKKRQDKNTNNLSILHGRSMCVHCRHPLAWYDLLPVISWIALKGRCRYCRKPISTQYPLVEILVAALFVLSYAVWPYGFDAIGIFLFSFWLLFLVGFTALMVYDVRWMLLPDKLVYPLLVLAITQVTLEAILRQEFSIIAEAVWGLIAVGGLFYVLFQISKGKWIGGGDVKLGFILGLLAGGFIEGLMVIFIASLLGTIASSIYVGKKGALKKRIPFGPFLIIATIIVYLFGGSIINWYQTTILLV